MLYVGSFLSPSPPIATVSANHELTVSGAFLVSVVPTGNAFDATQTSATMDFGDCAPGQLRNVQTLFKNNNANGYQVYMHLGNSNQLLWRAGRRPPDRLQLPSDLPNLPGVMGSPAPTSADTQATTGTVAAPANADRLTVSATIGDFSAAAQWPGTYSDVIAVTIVRN